MSSSKDYALEITPSVENGVASLNLIKFTVRHKEVSSLVTYKYHLIGVLQAILLAVIYFYWHNFLFNLGVVAVALAFLELAVFIRQTPEDTIIAMKDIGIQSISKKVWGFKTETFIPINNIIDLVIHEGFHEYGQCIFYLCALTKSNTVDFELALDAKLNAVGSTAYNDVIKVFFPEFLPRKDVLLEVWRLSREMLFGESRKYWRRVPGQGLKQIN